MKKCPTCNRPYDDLQSFCLEDGTPLTTESVANTQETVVLQRKSNKFLFIFIGLLLLIAVTVVGGILLFSERNNDSRQAAVNTQANFQTPIPLSTATPMPSPTVSSELANSNNSFSNAESNSPIVTDEPDVTVQPDKTPAEKQLPVIMKTEDHSVLFSLQQCRKSGSSITCEFLFTNKGADRQFQFVIYRSNLYDELGNGYDGKKGQLANKDGSNIRIDFISGVTAKAIIAFEGIEPNAAKITLLRLQYDVGEDYGLDVKFRNVPLTISK